MTVFDERGRLFGRLNIVDAALLGVACLLIPLAYGAWALFQPPTPRLLALTPSEVTLSNLQAIRIGRFEVVTKDLGPLGRFALRHRTGAPETPKDFIPVDFTWRNLTGGVFTVQPGVVFQGVYDLVLFDEAQPIARLDRALVVWPDPPPVQEEIIRGPRFQIETDQQVDAPSMLRLLVVRDRIMKACTLWRQDYEFRPAQSLGVVPCRK